MRFLFATILGLAAFAASAGATVAGAASSELPPAREFALTYERSGGLAASTELLRVAPRGFAVAESSGTRAGEGRVRFRLGGRRIRSLQRGLRAADLGSISTPKGGCADCYIYSLTYGGTSIELAETEVPARLQAVIDEIEAVIAAHTVPPAARAAHG
jgi:hypothetical protein